MPKNLDSSGSALQRPSGTAVFVYEPGEHGFALTAAPTGSVRLVGSDTAKGGSPATIVFACARHNSPG